MAEDFLPSDPRIDAYIAKAPAFAQPVLTHVRALVHRVLPEVRETIRWSRPHFAVDGRLIIGMSAFKAHCAVMIHGAGRQGVGMEYGRILSLADLPGDAELTEKLQAAVARRSAPVAPSAPRTPKAAIPVPEDFAAALGSNPAAQAHFDGFAPSHRREYLEWITEAKRPETRAKRLAQTIAWLAEGKKRNWQYEKC